jgi:hypothetical protein
MNEFWDKWAISLIAIGIYIVLLDFANATAPSFIDGIIIITIAAMIIVMENTLNE